MGQPCCPKSGNPYCLLLSFTCQACPECRRCQLKTKFRFVSRPFGLLAATLFSITLTLRSVHCHRYCYAVQSKFRYVSRPVPFVVRSPSVPCVSDRRAGFVWSKVRLVFVPPFPPPPLFTRRTINRINVIKLMRSSQNRQICPPSRVYCCCTD